MRLIDLSKQADKFCNNLSNKQFKQIVKAILALAKNPQQQDTKKLQDITPNYYRKDIGEYRIIYRYDQAILSITVIGKRNDNSVYKIFKNR